MTTKDTPEDVAVSAAWWKSRLNLFDFVPAGHEKSAKEMLETLIRAASEAEQRIAGERWLLADYKMCAEQWVKTLKEENDKLREEAERVEVVTELTVKWQEIDKLWPGTNTRAYNGQAVDILLNGNARIPDVYFDFYSKEFLTGGTDVPVVLPQDPFNKVTHWMPIVHPVDGLRIVRDGGDQKEPELLKNPSGWGHDQG